MTNFSELMSRFAQFLQTEEKKEETREETGKNELDPVQDPTSPALSGMRSPASSPEHTPAVQAPQDVNIPAGEAVQFGTPPTQTGPEKTGLSVEGILAMSDGEVEKNFSEIRKFCIEENHI